MNQKANFKTVTLKDLWGVFVQRLWAIILAACICCGGFLVFNRMTFVPQYASTATLYILRQADGATASDASSDFSLALKVVNDCTYLLKRHTVLDEVISSLNLDMEYEDPDTRQISMISFLRDLYVQIPGGYSDNRLNAAYVFGGFPLLMDTLHTNFGVSIDGCFEVDFSGFQSVIDILGGVDIEMTSKEARTINIGTEAGVYHLDGTKALAYSRIRKIDNDFYRTQRQRNVLQAIYTKFRQSNAADLMKLLDEVLPYLSTDMTNSQIMLLAAKCIPIMGSAELSSYRVPADDAYHYASIRGMSVVVPDLDKIHEDLLNEYLPLNAEKESSE